LASKPPISAGFFYALARQARPQSGHSKRARDRFRGQQPIRFLTPLLLFPQDHSSFV
jgi:hypothetical protein